MTQGDFYKQFDNKEALECKATEVALSDNFALCAKTIEGQSDPVTALKAGYLSPQRLSAVGRGCTSDLSAISDLRRQYPATGG
ncbi:hypothetical protein ABMC88_00645 [Sulfitobacter sp. HNIBRBA2951]|uniref:hypothetical protein n=1 Tax=Sulfitobacter aquimarinus TaxID=3158557 RepID=UPI0032DFC6E7